MGDTGYPNYLTVNPDGSTGQFLQLAGAASGLQIAAGVSATGSFAGQTMMTGTIAHGLGRIPISVGLIGGNIATFAGGSDVPIILGITNLNSTVISWRARISNASQSNNSTPIWWIAIG